MPEVVYRDLGYVTDPAEIAAAMIRAVNQGCPVCGFRCLGHDTTGDTIMAMVHGGARMADLFDDPETVILDEADLEEDDDLDDDEDDFEDDDDFDDDDDLDDDFDDFKDDEDEDDDYDDEEDED